MERISVMKSISCSLSQPPVFNVMEPTLSYTSFTQKPNLCDASFSAYLKRDEPNPPPSRQQHVGCTVADDCEISIFDAQKYFNETTNEPTKDGNNIVSSLSVDVHGINSEVPCRFSSVSSVDAYSRNYRARSFHATPTASSEASWNSQTGLLSHPPGSVKVSFTNLNPTDVKKRGTTSSRWFFGRTCPCSGKKSVQVDEKLSQTKTLGFNNTTSNGSSNSKEHTLIKSVENVVEKAPNKPLAARDWSEKQDVIAHPHHSHRFSFEESRISPSKLGHHVSASGTSTFSDATATATATAVFSFPILKQSSPVKLVLNRSPHAAAATSPTSQDPPRDSLEVFHPPDESISRKSSAELQQRERRSFTLPASPKSRTDDDVASDASSDLFEIESFSTQTPSYSMYHCRDSLDEASSFNARRLAAAAASGAALYCRSSPDEAMTPSIAPTECYEPSEASIDWSVTTAEGFDRASVTNFSITASEADEFAHELENRSGGNGGGGDVGGSKRRGNGLLSCRCEKAVNVGPHPVRCVPEGHRVPASSTIRHVNGRPPMFNKPSLATSHSARLSLPFAA